MASIKIEANISSAEKSLKSLQTQIENLEKAASKVKIEIKTDGIQKLDKDMQKTVQTLTKYANAQARLAEAQAKTQKSANDLAIAQQKTAQAVEKTKQEIEKTRQSHEKYNAAVEKTKQAAEKTAQVQTKTAQALNKTGEAAEQAGKKMQGFVSTFVKSAVIYQAIYAIRGAFLDALDTMKNVETELVNVQKVTKATQGEINAIKDTAYEKAATYGVDVTDYLKSVVEFARAGYQDASESLAELSTKTQIAGNVTSDVANQFLLSMDAAYKYEGSISALTKVLDGANEIGNNYATSVQKIAEGLGIIAPIASQVRVSEEELTAALGTITAVTQRSGSEAARALRSLFLNIIGDTTTEIEDGVTATEESVKSLQSLLKKYAPDAVAAAEATGQIIDPMEAIGSLSQAMKDGLLTEQELMEQLSALGGKLRTSQLTALVSNWDMYEKMMETYKTAAGSADREVGLALDTWERKAAKLANTWAQFIEKSLSTDAFKGLIDALTTILNLVGNLGNALITVGGAFTVFKVMIPQIKQLTQLARDAAANGDAEGAVSYAKSAESMKGLATGIAVATTAITVYNMAAQKHKQALQEATEAAKKESDTAKEQAQTVYDLYAAYNTANKAYEEGTGSKEALEAATSNLIAALSDESNALWDENKSLEENTKAVLENAKAKAEAAKNAAMYEFMDSVKIGSNTGVQWLDDLINNFGGIASYADLTNGVTQNSFQDTTAAYIKMYEKAKGVVEEYTKATQGGKKANEELEQSYRSAQKFIGAFGSSLENIIGYDDAIAELDDKIQNLPNAFSDLSDEAEASNAKLEEAAQKYTELGKAVDEATAAIQKYKEETATEQGDAYSGYAGIYEDFLTDWEKGLKGSNKVKAAVKALLPDDVLADLWKQGKDAGELLASDFYKGIFTYVDENGTRQFTKGEDAGSLLAYALWDDQTIGRYTDQGKEIVDLAGNVAATITEEADGLKVQVKDFDALAKAMYEVSGVTLDGEVWAAWLQALGMYSPELEYTADDILKIAESVGAVNDAGQIDLQELVKGQLEAGEDAQNIRDMADAIIDLQQNGEADVDIGAESVDEAKDKVNKLIEDFGTAKETGEQPIEVQAETKKAEQDLDRVERKERQIEAASPTITVKTAGVQEALNAMETVRVAASNATAAANTAATGMAAAAAIAQSVTKHASGTKNSPGGLVLVNEQGPEVIQEGPFARIAGGGKPTLTWMQPGATVYTASESRQILGGVDPSALYDGINAYAGGTASGITRWSKASGTAAAAADTTSTGGGSSSGSSGGGGRSSSSASSSSSTKNEKDEHLEYLKSEVSLREAALALMKAQNLPTKNLIEQEKQIQSALMNEINYLKQIGASDEEIYKLYTQWYNVQKEIADLQKAMLDELSKAIDNQITKLNDKREEEKQIIQDQIDAMEEARKTRDEQLDLEEKILAVQKAEAALQNAMTERTVRYFNSITGQWEWAANAQSVKSAAEQLEEAQKALEDYQDEAAYNAAVNELKAQQDAIDAKYDDLEKRWQDVLDTMAEPVTTIADALNNLARNYVPTMAGDIKTLNSLLAQFGYNINTSSGRATYSATSLPVFDSGGVLGGVGGIKATAMNEMVVPPDITSAMLSPYAGNAFATRMAELRYLYGVGGASMAGSVSNTIGSQHNGDVYTFGNISLSREQAESTSVAQLAMLSRNLRLYSSNM